MILNKVIKLVELIFKKNRETLNPKDFEFKKPSIYCVHCASADHYYKREKEKKELFYRIVCSHCGSSGPQGLTPKEARERYEHLYAGRTTIPVCVYDGDMETIKYLESVGHTYKERIIWPSYRTLNVENKAGKGYTIIDVWLSGNSIENEEIIAYLLSKDIEITPQHLSEFVFGYSRKFSTFNQDNKEKMRFFKIINMIVKRFNNIFPVEVFKEMYRYRSFPPRILETLTIAYPSLKDIYAKMKSGEMV